MVSETRDTNRGTLARSRRDFVFGGGGQCRFTLNGQSRVSQIGGLYWFKLVYQFSVVLIILLAEGHVTVGASVGMRESRTLAECPSFGCLAPSLLQFKRGPYTGTCCWRVRSIVYGSPTDVDLLMLSSDDRATGMAERSIYSVCESLQRLWCLVSLW